MRTTNWRLALSVQAICVQASWTGVRVMFGYRALAMGADPLFLTLLASSFALPALMVAVPAGRISDRVGGSLIAVAGMVVAAAGSLSATTISGLWLLLTASIGTGCGVTLMMVGLQTFVANVSTGQDADSAFGTLSAAASIGQLIGPPVVTVLASLSYLGGQQTDPNTAVGLGLCAALAAAGIPAYIILGRIDRTLSHARMTTKDKPAQISALLRTKGMWRSLAVSGVVLVSVDLMYAFVPVWATDRGIGATTVGLLLALRAAVSVASRFGLSTLTARFGRTTLIVASLLAAVAGLVALPFVNVWGAVAVMIGLGLGLGLPQPLTMAWVTSLTPAETHGTTLGMRLTSNRIAQIALPLAVGTLAGPLGVAGIFWANAGLLLGAVAAMYGSNADGPEPG